MTRAIAAACALAIVSCSTGGDGDPDAAPDLDYDMGPCPDLTGIPAVVELGTGDLMFEPLTDGQTVGLVMGCQGGFHVWTAVRARGLCPLSPILDMTMTRVSDGLPLAMLFHVRSTLTEVGTTDQYEGFGYRLQVNDRTQVLDQDIEIRATVTDRRGRSASDSRRVHVVDGGSACTTLDLGLDGPAPRDPDAGASDAATSD